MYESKIKLSINQFWPKSKKIEGSFFDYVQTRPWQPNAWLVVAGHMFDDDLRVYVNFFVNRS